MLNDKLVDLAFLGIELLVILYEQGQIDRETLIKESKIKIEYLYEVLY
jgi:hypothetical protein